MEFFRHERQHILALALVAGLGATACGGEAASTSSATPPAARATQTASPPAGSQTCTAAKEQFQRTPSLLSPARIAQTLGRGVTTTEVANGQYGPAHCEPGMSEEEVYDGNGSTLTVSVPGIGKLCLIVGIGGDTPPQQGKIYQDLLVDCPAGQ